MIQRKAQRKTAGWRGSFISLVCVSREVLCSLGFIVVLVLVTGRYSGYQWSLPVLASLIKKFSFVSVQDYVFHIRCRNIVLYCQTVGWQAVL
jgi:hypothetical protein